MIDMFAKYLFLGFLHTFTDCWIRSFQDLQSSSH